MSLIFLDIDGTLYSHVTESIPASADEACRKAHEKGHHLFLSTGRSIHQIKYFTALPYIDGAAASNGANCYINGRRIYSCGLEKEQVKQLILNTEKYHTGVSLQSDLNNFLNEDSYSLILQMIMESNHLQREEAMKQFQQIVATKKICEWRNEPIYKCDVYFNTESDAEGFIDAIDPSLEFSPMLSEAAGKARGGEITAHGVTKALGAEKISEAMQISLRDAYAIGDGMNDIHLIEACGHGIAMGNGKTALKEKSDYVTQDADHDGIWNAFQHFGIL